MRKALEVHTKIETSPFQAEVYLLEALELLWSEPCSLTFDLRQDCFSSRANISGDVHQQHRHDCGQRNTALIHLPHSIKSFNKTMCQMSENWRKCFWFTYLAQVHNFSRISADSNTNTWKQRRIFQA